MATAFLSTAITFLPSRLSSASASSSFPLTTPSSVHTHRDNTRKLLTICKAVNDPPPPSPILTKRALSLCSITTFFFSLAGQGGSNANAAILEADDDEELLEKVKKDRKKRLEKQGVINSSNEEKGFVPSLYVYTSSRPWCKCMIGWSQIFNFSFLSLFFSSNSHV